MARKTKSQTAQDVITHVINCWDQHQDATTDRRDVWEELWDAYSSRQDYEAKAGWQSKLFIPKTWSHIERASAEIRRAMLQVDRLFKLELDDANERTALLTYKRAVAREDNPNEIARLKAVIDMAKLKEQDRRTQLTLDEMRFKRDLIRTNFASVYSIMTKPAFLLGLGLIKIGWDQARSRTSYRHIDAFNYALDPTWTPESDSPPRWEIERAVIPLPELHELARNANEQAGETIFQLSQVNKIRESYADEKQAAEDARYGISHNMRTSKQVELMRFWGKLPKDDDTGYQTEDPELVIIANRRYMIRRTPNPFSHAKAPYIRTYPLTWPHRGLAGGSLVEQVVPLNYAYNNLINLTLDSSNYSVNKMFQVDPQKLNDARNMHSVYPGKVWSVNWGNDRRPVVQEVPVSPISADAINLLNHLSRDIQEADSVTEFLQGMPGKKATATEIQIKTMESRGLFEIIAKEMERFSLKQTLEMTWDLYAEFADYPPREGLYNIQVGGISLLLAQKELMESIATILSLVFKAGEVLAPMTDIQDLWKRYLATMNLADVYKEPRQGMPAPRPEQLDAMMTQGEIHGQQMAQNLMQGLPQ